MDDDNVEHPVPRDQREAIEDALAEAGAVPTVTPAEKQRILDKINKR